MNDLFDLVSGLTLILERIIPILIGLAVVLFLYGLLRYIVSKNPETRKEAINVITYGVVAIFVMVSIWGIVTVIADTIGVDVGGTIDRQPINTEDLIR